MKNYWNNNGRYQDKYNELEKLIPQTGKANSLGIEVLRCISNIYHDYYNNGFGNVYRQEIDFIRCEAALDIVRHTGSRAVLDFIEKYESFADGELVATDNLTRYYEQDNYGLFTEKDKKTMEQATSDIIVWVWDRMASEKIAEQSEIQNLTVVSA